MYSSNVLFQRLKFGVGITKDRRRSVREGAREVAELVGIRRREVIQGFPGDGKNARVRGCLEIRLVTTNHCRCSTTVSFQRPTKTPEPRRETFQKAFGSGSADSILGEPEHI